LRLRIAPPLAVVAAAGVFALVCSLGGCSSKEQRFAEHLQRAQDYQEAGQAKEAMLELRSALQLEPKSAEANYRIAKLLARQGKPADAAFFYRETTRLDPTRTDAALAEAKLVLFDDTARAEQLVKGVLEREPKNAEAYVRKSEIALARSKSDDALQAALTAQQLAPDDGMTWMALGIVQMARIREHSIKNEPVPQSLFEDAEKAFKGAIARFKIGVNARIELARLYAIWPDHRDQAKQAYRDAIAAADNANRRGVAATTAVSYARAVHDEDFLREALAKLVEAVPADIDAWDDIARLSDRDKEGSGEDVYKQLLQKRPQDAQARIHYAAYLEAHGRPDDALKVLQDQVAAGVEPALALDRIVALELGQNHSDAARAALDRLEKEYANHPRTDLARGRVALAEGRLSDAATALRRYVGNEETSEGQRLLAVVELRQRHLPAAVAAVDRALQLEKGSKAVLLRLKATIHSAANDNTQVVQTLRRLAAEEGQLRPSEQLLLAHALYEMKRADAARKVLLGLIDTGKAPVGAYVEYAQREIRTDSKRAREYLEHALEMSPRNPAALRLAAQIDLGENRPDAALARIDKAAAAGPLPPAVILLRAQILAAKQDWPHAEDEARRAFAAAPELPGALELLASIYVSQNKVDEAISSFQQAEQAGALPTSGEQLLARLLLAAGRRDEAKALFEKVIAQGGDQPGAKNDLAWLLADQGTDLERALTLAQEAQQARPESAEIADTLGYVYLKKGLFDPALQQFGYAIELASRSASSGSGEVERPEYYYHQGLAFQALGRNPEAVKAFEQALSLDSKFGQADDARRQLEAAKASGHAGAG
jgi:tetratricopeptide (TPR) repeat protein